MEGKIKINKIDVTYINTKTDKFGNVNTYFKISGPNPKHKLKPILSQMCEECKIPLWETDEGEYMLRVKKKYVPEFPEEPTPGTPLTLILVFKYYCMEIDGLLKQGYYAQMFLYTIAENE